MPVMKFANVLLETNPRALAFPTLYYKADAPVVFDDESGAWLIDGAGVCDFTTYFNALSVQKLSKYTTATDFTLHIEIKGAAATVSQTKAYPLSSKSEVVESSSVSVPAGDTWTSVDIPLDVDKNLVLAGFQIATRGPIHLRNGYYMLSLSTEPRTIDLAVATTTFKKEAYITRNIELVKNEILGSDEDIAKHFTMHVVDNGRTLDATALSDEHVHVYPNDNVGGAGGFARGMIAAMEQPVPATNVLLMDDDVEVSPESLKRTYKLLQILKPEYYEAFISGAMLSYEEIQDQWEDTGFIDPAVGNCRPAKPPLCLTKFPDVIYNEVFKLPDEVKDAKQYAAWWYCCIPVSMIKRNGLPLPFFVRYDDVEYGIRSHPILITMNGLGIWHSNFHIRYNSAVERYQTVRNGMIAQCTTGIAPDLDVLVKQMRKDMYLELKKFNYADAELVLKGFEDFLRGPSFISQPVAQERFMSANKEKERMYSFDEVTEQAKEYGIDDLDLYAITRQDIDIDHPRSLTDRLVDFATCNFQRTVFKRDGEGYSVIPNTGWAYPAGKIRREHILIVIDWYNQKAAIRVKDIARYDRIVKRYKRDVAYLRKHEARLKREYVEARPSMTSVEYWKKYLKID